MAGHLGYTLRGIRWQGTKGTHYEEFDGRALRVHITRNSMAGH